MLSTPLECQVHHQKHGMFSRQDEEGQFALPLSAGKWKINGQLDGLPQVVACASRPVRAMGQCEGSSMHL